ncbi:hypothetical protein L3X38_036286 [Prunus dulcis]|uniref:Uncharacterized protein n=1 Tax=Prunus dulcis TaxID=3755 RepID=A0AAD4V2G2_PRUDU|nr:hypothetical protein L3X38_036286 [Prunus dulcis]
MILYLLADSQKHAVNPAKSATQACASIATTKGSAFHTSSPKSTWSVDSGATDHMTFDPGQLLVAKISSQGRRLVVVLGGANSTTLTGHRIVRPRLVKLS